jgi:hypothetical protein
MVGMRAGWSEPRGASASSAAAPTIPDSLKPLLHECYAMYDLLTPYALQPLAFARSSSPRRSLMGLKQMGLPSTRVDALGAMSELLLLSSALSACMPCVSPSVWRRGTARSRTKQIDPHKQKKDRVAAVPEMSTQRRHHTLLATSKSCLFRVFMS